MDSVRESTLRKIETGSLILAATFASVSCLYFSGFKLNGFVFWALVPYAVYFVLSRFILTQSSFSTLAGCIVAALMLVFTLVVYIDGFFVHTSSTSALLFLFVPLFLLIGGPVVLGLVLGTSKFVHGRGDGVTKKNR